MGDYGLRISADGTDVKTCNDLDTIVNSKFSLLKGTISGTYTYTVHSGNIATITLNHDLGYIPMANVAFDAGGIYGSNRYYVFPYFDVTLGVRRLEAWCEADVTNIYMKTIWIDYAHGNDLTYTVKWFIYLDKANLN